MLARLVFLFVAVPLIELVLLLVLSEATNWIFTLLTVLATGALGALLAKQQGVAAFRLIRRDLARGSIPGSASLDAALILIAGAFLLTPGVLTDLVGISLLIPPVRRRYKTWLLRWFQSRFLGQAMKSEGEAIKPTVVIDSYVVEGPPPANSRGQP